MNINADACEHSSHTSLLRIEKKQQQPFNIFSGTTCFVHAHASYTFLWSSNMKFCVEQMLHFMCALKSLTK